MHAFRIVHQRFIDKLLGEGARLYGGRWNPIGFEVVYSSDSVATALLELLAHSKILEIDQYHLMTFDVPDRLARTTISIKELPRGWSRYPAPARLRQIGQEWVLSQKTAVLQVPSAVVPDQYNFLFNPAHSQYKKIKIIKTKPLMIDERLVK